MRYLTKSRYKLGLECPNKLFYTKKKEYADTKVEDPFLEALASGGFQVEELAKLHYPGGILIEDRKSDGSYDYEEKIAATNELLKRENVVIFEAAFRYNNLFIRVDILEKKGNNINLIEVKAKSFDSSDCEYEFIGKRGGLSGGWKYYLFDVAFQKYVIEKSYEDFTVTPFLMLADKHKTTTIDGLNQLFRVTKQADNRTGVECKLEKLDYPAEQSVLTKVDVSVPLQGIESGQHRILEEYDFETSIQVLSDTYENDRYFGYPLKFPVCKQCEFKTEEETAHLKSGFQECFSKQMGWTDVQFKKPNAFEIWDFRSWKSLEEQGKLLLEELDESDFGNLNAKPGSMSRVERQLIQREKSIANDPIPYLLKEELKAALDSWQYPLNFIDFETSTAPLPFFAGQKPYEQVAFQFSHHIFHEDGRVEHARQYINVNAGEFPNFEFLRALKASLGKNEGSIFMFSNHENTVLNQVMVQLLESQEADKNDLIAFAQSITRPTGNSSRTWNGDRAMIDLCKVIKDYYYNPFTKGSNSIKKVLPAVFESSAYIQKKYTKPIGEIGLNSLNFDAGKVWLNIAGENVQDPYKTLPSLFEEWDDDFELVSEMEDISDGGAAMTAYGKLQYTDMSEAERNEIKDALLRYCELDTLAMVMIYEHLREVVDN
ncbi:MAG: DUF2779 domain-containing protein [Bacteroidetes bacterium HGW-Bacteroidetes-2]|jgi:hypothetical protein|nr:MAG: DUF2779 domain-containing protein [Bacteroidetes bacterium HGW-Bacteroidetes-8]PKP26717.1 MAG: DUF2779 domain-containing protein [Bacteroidetes bacterium HGW-Bacteroidetes-2]